MKWKYKILIGAVLVMAFFVISPTKVHRQKRAELEAYQKELKDHGEKLTPAEIAPHFSAEEEDTARKLRSVFFKLGYGSIPPAAKMLAPGHALISWKESDLESEDSSNIWNSLRAELSVHSNTLANLRAATLESRVGVNLDYNLGFMLPVMHLSSTKDAESALSATAILELHDGHSAEALDDVISGVRLTRICEREPVLISQLVHLLMVATAANMTWEALQYPELRDEQLAQLQAEWNSVELITPMQSAIAMERALQPVAFDMARREYTNTVAVALGQTPAKFDWGEFLANPSAGYTNLINRYPRYWAWKSRWSYDEQIYDMKIVQSGLEATRQFESNGAFVPAMETLDIGLTNLDKTYAHVRDKFLLDLVDGWMRRSMLKFGLTEMQRRMVVTAIALRRFQIAHGKYPDGLNELVPAFLAKLPIDSMDGKPLRYKRKPDGTFLLYSVGTDGKDDGGDPSPDKSTTSFSWIAGRDAVWPMPANEGEIKAYKEKMHQEWLKKQPSRDGAVRPTRMIQPAPAATNTATK